MLLISFFSFAIIDLAPGDISSMYLTEDMSPEEKQIVIEKLGLKKSMPEQYSGMAERGAARQLWCFSFLQNTGGTHAAQAPALHHPADGLLAGGVAGSVHPTGLDSRLQEKHLGGQCHQRFCLLWNVHPFLLLWNADDYSFHCDPAHPAFFGNAHSRSEHPTGHHPAS